MAVAICIGRTGRIDKRIQKTSPTKQVRQYAIFERAVDRSIVNLKMNKSVTFVFLADVVPRVVTVIVV